MHDGSNDLADDAAARSPWRSDVFDACGVGLGGAVGASARWFVGQPFTSTSSDVVSFPWSTFVVNVVGCLLVGLAGAVLHDTHRLRPLLVTGVLGGFTTMSAFAVELNDLADASRGGLAVVYLGATLATGAGAVLVGDELADRRRRTPGGAP